MKTNPGSFVTERPSAVPAQLVTGLDQQRGWSGTRHTRRPGYLRTTARPDSSVYGRGGPSQPGRRAGHGLLKGQAWGVVRAETERLAVERQLGLQRPLDGAGLLERVAFAGEDQAGVRDRTAPQGLLQSHGLGGRHDGVGRPVEQQDRSTDALDP
jgi:hypothetical protein